MEGADGFGSTCHTSFEFLHVAGGILKYTHQNYTLTCIQSEKTQSLYPITINIPVIQASLRLFFLLGLPVSAIKLGIDYRPCLRHPLRGDSQAGKGRNRSSEADKSPNPEKKRGHNWTVSVYIVFKYFLTVPGI